MAEVALEHLAKVYPLLEDAERFVEHYQRQKDLAERLASLKGKEKPLRIYNVKREKPSATVR